MNRTQAFSGDTGGSGACVGLSWAVLCWAWQPGRHASSTHTAAEGISVVLANTFITFLPFSALFTPVTCVHRVEWCRQTGRCWCVHVCVGSTTDASARARGRRRPGQTSDAQPQTSQAIRFNSGWLTLLLWLRRLEWQACSSRRLLCGPTLLPEKRQTDDQDQQCTELKFCKLQGEQVQQERPETYCVTSTDNLTAAFPLCFDQNLIIWGLNSTFD